MAVIQCEGLRVLFTGTLSELTRLKARQALVLAHGEVCYRATQAFDVAVVGRKPGKRALELIASRGKPQLDEEQFKRLIQFGELDLSDDVSKPAVSPGHAVSELRGIFDGEASRHQWRDVVDVLNHIEDARYDEVLTYVEAHVSRWGVDESRQWHSSIVEHKLPDSASWVGGDLRVAPLEWIKALLDGDDHSRLSVVRALSLEGTGAKTTTASKLFASTHLGQLKHLDCGRDLKLTKTFFKKLARCEAMKNLETLVYYPYKKSGSGGELAKAEHFTSLKHLKVRYADYGIDFGEACEDLKQLLAADWIGQIESLESNMGCSPYVSCSSALMNKDVLGAHADRFTSLKRLIMGDYVSTDHAKPYAALFERIESLSLVARSYYDYKYPAWHSAMATLEGVGRLATPELKELDVRQLVIYAYDRESAAQSALIKALGQQKIIRRLERVVIGEYAELALWEAFGVKHDVDIVV